MHSLQCVMYSICHVHILSLQLVRLYRKYRKAEVHRKALVFQKNYLNSQVDAFFQIQQVALIMMTNMGAPPADTTKSKSNRSSLHRLKIAVHAVMAVFRFHYVVRRKNQYIQSYENRVEREKAAAFVGHQKTEHIRPTTCIGTASNYHSPPLHYPMYPSFPPPTTTHVITPGPIVTDSTKPTPSHTLPAHVHSQPTSHNEQPQLSTFLPSLARLQAKLSGTVH